MKPITVSIILIMHTICYAQKINQELQPEGKDPFLVGKISKEGLLKPPYFDWFSKSYKEYNPDEKNINLIETLLKEHTIYIFMGTWCGDSKREVPRFYKVLEESNFPLDRVTTVAVQRDRDHYKQSPGGEHEGLNIHRVPTFIFYKNGTEVNRIVESPKKTLEEDILAILSNNYTPNYSSVVTVNKMIETKGLSYFSKKKKKIKKQLQNNVESMYELNTYANVLFYAGKIDKAIEVLLLNTLLFPNNAKTYISLGNKYLQIEDKSLAIKYYKASLEIEKNEQIEEKLRELEITHDQS